MSDRNSHGLFSTYILPRNDMKTGLSASHVWGALGWHDIRQRYRRSVIGPFWFTISTAILVGVLGTLYSTLLRQEIGQYLPFLGVGLVLWQFIASTVTEGCNVFIGSANLIKQSNIPLTVHVARIVWHNFIILLHTLPVVLIAFFIFNGLPDLEFILVPFGLLLLLLHGVWIGLVLGIFCTRFRDIAPVVSNLLQVAFFFTPIMWSPDVLQGRAWVAHYNPLYHMIEIVRAPILGRPVSPDSWLWSLVILVAGFAFAQFMLTKYRNRVAYWL